MPTEFVILVPEEAAPQSRESHRGLTLLELAGLGIGATAFAYGAASEFMKDIPKEHARTALGIGMAAVGVTAFAAAYKLREPGAGVENVRSGVFTVGCVAAILGIGMNTLVAENNAALERLQEQLDDLTGESET